MVQQPAQGNLLGLHAMFGGQLIEGFEGVGVIATEREPGDEGNVLLPSTDELSLLLTIFDAVHILHRYDGHELLGLFNLGHTHFG